MNFKKTNIFVALFFCAGSIVLGQTDQSMIRRDLKGSSLSGDGPPDTLPVYVEVATIQPNVEQGIVFTLNIENNSTKTIRIIDPIDTTRIGLTGMTYPFTKSLRNTKPDSSICYIGSISPENLKAIHDDKMSKRPFQAFDFNEARRNPRLKTVSDIVPWERPPHQSNRAQSKAKPLSESERFDAKVGGKLTLEPGERFQAVLQISRVYADYQGYKKADKVWRNDYLSPGPGGIGTIASGAPQSPKPEITPIPSDKYYLSVSILLFTDDGGSYIASSYAVPSDKLIIQLGPPSSPEKDDTVVP